MCRQVDDALEAVTEANPLPTRYLRKDAARATAAAAAAAEAAAAAGVDGERAASSKVCPFV